MDQDSLSDAEILWGDVLELLADTEMPPSTLAMLRSCEAVGLDGSTLRIRAARAFTRRKVLRQQDVIEAAIEEAAFEHLDLIVDLAQDVGKTVDTGSTMTPEEVMRATASWGDARTARDEATTRPSYEPPQDRRIANPLYEAVPVGSSKLTFDRFVAGEENIMALEAAKQVANGENKSYNPLFIHGRSGLGKTHLLRAIQNYITTNDPSRLCVYRTAGDFIDEYVSAVRDEHAALPKSSLARHYQDIDVLIIDDIQNMSTAAGSIRFFFETFNYLTSHGKQVVLAADRSPSQLGLGDSSFDERDTSRMDSGVTVSIQVPDYELKLNLIRTFYERMRADAEAEHVSGMSGTISDENIKVMAEMAGANIRTIESYVQSCLLRAYQKERQGTHLTHDDVVHEALQKWPTGQHVVTVEHIQRAVERFYDVRHDELVGSKRNKELMEPRHVGIWLTRTLTDNTLADIGKRFGGRSHATVKHSIAWVDKAMREDRIFSDRVETLQADIADSSS